jgi:broad specificity phosphatase PhoE
MRAARFLLVRHGETASNREDRFRGRLDVPLNDDGRRQAGAVARALAGEPLRAVYTSPLSRALDTARAISLPHGLAPVPFEPIGDFHFGEWQGKLRSEARSIWPEEYRLYEREPPRFRAPGGESFAELLERVRAGLLALAAKHSGDTIALASHAVVCKAALLVSQGFGLERYWDMKVGNCSISEFSHGPEGWTLARADDRRHLGEDPYS